MSPEIDDNIFKAVTLTNWFMYVVFREVEYLVCEIKPNNTKNFLWKKTRKINGVVYFNLWLSSKTSLNYQALLLDLLQIK